jgi:hypothetical protein
MSTFSESYYDKIIRMDSSLDKLKSELTAYVDIDVPIHFHDNDNDNDEFETKENLEEKKHYYAAKLNGLLALDVLLKENIAKYTKQHSDCNSALKTKTTKTSKKNTFLQWLRSS